MLKWLFGRRLAEAEKQLTQATAAAQEMAKHAYLVDIKREGRSLKFIFIRNGEMYTIETMSLMSDNTTVWKRNLLG